MSIVEIEHLKWHLRMDLKLGAFVWFPTYLDTQIENPFFENFRKRSYRQ